MSSLHEFVADPAVLAREFPHLETRADVASILDVPFPFLTHVAYARRPDSYYVEWDIQKRAGGTRRISAPRSSLYVLQARLNRVLQAVYHPKACVHGFVSDRSTVTNATPHVGRRHVLNVDIEDFFPSLNFGRVRGVLLAPPFEIGEDAATVSAQLACYQGALPIGAPTSPVLANMICMRMDGALMRLAGSHSALYTRYADDMTFSTDRREFPEQLAVQTTDGLAVGLELKNVIEENGFQLQQGKTRLQTHPSRQEVTGVIVNKRTNVDRRFVRQIRAMLHSLQTLGPDGAQAKFEEVDGKDRWPGASPKFVDVVNGKLAYLAMVRGQNDDLVSRLKIQFANLLEGKPKNLDVPIPEAARHDTQTVTVLFSDIQDSTGMAVRLGDQAWADLISLHDELVRQAAESAGAVMIKMLGDGSMVVFASVLNAATAASQMQREVAGFSASQRLNIRIGMHTGDAVRLNNDYIGAAVNMAARISDAASGGEILISEVIRTLLGEKWWQFGASRDVELRGFESLHTVIPLIWDE